TVVDIRIGNGRIGYIVGDGADGPIQGVVDGQARLGVGRPGIGRRLDTAAHGIVLVGGEAVLVGEARVVQLQKLRQGRRVGTDRRIIVAHAGDDVACRIVQCEGRGAAAEGQ